MTVIPTKIEDQIPFIINHAELWAQDPDSVGLDAATVAEIFGAGQLALTRQSEADVARQESTQATANRNVALDDALKKISLAIQEIRIFADRSADPAAVYAAAALPEPKVPAELKAPPAPTNVNIDFENASGFVKLMWKNPTSLAFQGKTWFRIFRSLIEPVAGSGLPVVNYVPIGDSGERTFTDEAVPSGYGQILYQVRAIRNGKLSPFSEPAFVRLTPTGTMVSSSSTPEGSISEAA